MHRPDLNLNPNPAVTMVGLTEAEAQAVKAARRDGVLMAVSAREAAMLKRLRQLAAEGCRFILVELGDRLGWHKVGGRE